ncbi:MAG: phosphoribosylanthranilate isomerase [Campylobacterota bacterium]|nr:phosphoribosylanthranilate isomerase [Campylobacterota bacterium]
MNIIKTRVKICGITNLNDALNAIEAGADTLGFVFYDKSPRFIDPIDARDIIRQLPPFVQTVGLFVNLYGAEVDFIVKRSEVDIAQIHFGADHKFYTSLQSKYLKVIRAKSKNDILQYKDEYRIVDAFVDSYGGEGKRLELNWFKDIDCSKIILAGGLTSDNLKEIKEYNFYGVDVSSGVELSKGIKDKDKMNRFIEEVKRIDELHR